MSLLMVLVDGISTCWCMRLQWRTGDFYCTSVAPLNAHHHHQQYYQSIINIFIRLLFRILAPAAAVLDQNACSLINPLLGACGKKKVLQSKALIDFLLHDLKSYGIKASWVTRLFDPFLTKVHIMKIFLLHKMGFFVWPVPVQRSFLLSSSLLEDF